MRILHIEPSSLPTQAFIEELHASTGCIVEHAASIDEGVSKILEGHGSTDIVLFPAGPNASDVFAFPDRVRATTTEAVIRCPQFVVLASSPIPLPSAAKCIDRQVIYLLRGYPKQIIETVKAMLWKIRTSKPGPTIRVEFYGGHYRFFLCGPTTSLEILVSMQIGKLLVLLLSGTRTVDMLADALGISRQSVKKYMRELRLILQSMSQTMFLAGAMADMVWMERNTGGTLCGLRANPLWQ